MSAVYKVNRQDKTRREMSGQGTGSPTGASSVSFEKLVSEVNH